MITPVKAGESAVGADDESVTYVDVAGAATCSRIRPAVRHGQVLVQKKYWLTPLYHTFVINNGLRNKNTTDRNNCFSTNVIYTDKIYRKDST